MEKWFIIPILIVLFAAFIISTQLLQRSPQNKTTVANKTEAIALVQNYLKEVYPNSSVEIVYVVPSPQFNGSWLISAVVTKNPHSPCPETFVVDFNTFFSLDKKYQNNLTRGCVVFGAASNPGSYIYARKEEAMSRASTIFEVNEFLKDCTGVYVDAYPTLVNNTQAWEVVYSCSNKQPIKVYITQIGGNLIGITR